MSLINAKINVRQLALTFKGSKSKQHVESKGFHNIPHYGTGQNVFKNDSDAIKFVQHLIIEEVFDREYSWRCWQIYNTIHHYWKKG